MACKIDNVILGYGQIGQAIKDHLKGTIKAYDRGEWEKTKNLQTAKILHVCIPYSASFITTVEQAREVFNPSIIVIHSTVKPGTTKNIKNACYSPVMGRHHDGFSKNIAYYAKYIACSKVKYLILENYFKINVQYWGENTKELEFAKIMSTSYMYWNLIYQKSIYETCKQEGFDPEKVYQQWNTNYNTGIRHDHSNWQRPIYEHDNNPIPGGHCLVPNTELHENLITDILSAWTKYEGQMAVTMYKV